MKVVKAGGRHTQTVKAGKTSNVLSWRLYSVLQKSRLYELLPMLWWAFNDANILKSFQTASVNSSYSCK